MKTAVRDGAFRADLFYRLNILPVYLPPLRERRTDISSLTDYFLEGFIIEFQRSIGLETDVYPLLEGYPWPGNVRELKSLLKRVFLLTEKSMLNATDFAPHLDDETDISEDTLLPLERGVGTSTLYRRLAKYGL